MDKNTRKMINCLIKEKYTNYFDETILNITSQNNKEKSPFDLLIKLGSKSILILIFEKCDDYTSINIKSQINFCYPLYLIISEKKYNTSIINRLEYKDKKIEIYENIIEHNCGLILFYINKENELNADINIIFKDIKNLDLDFTSDKLELNDTNENKSVKILKDNNDIMNGINIKIKPLTNVFFALKAKNIFENFSYSFENKYTIYY